MEIQLSVRTQRRLVVARKSEVVTGGFVERYAAAEPEMGEFVMASSPETSVQDRVKELALEITLCPALTGAETAGPCSKVVEWQADQLRAAGHDESEIRDAMHVPEGWAGNLATAKILYLSSNPSFDISENYPNVTWPQTATVDFVTRRFSSEQSRPYGALDGPTQRDMDRVIQQDGRPGKKVNTWAELRKRTSILLERPVDEISADRDYVMTEVVHCKSKGEQGVPEAVSACTLRWLSQILELCPARILIVSGGPAGAAFKSATAALTNGAVKLPDTWGNWSSPKPKGQGPWPFSTDLDQTSAAMRWGLAEQSMHTVEITLPIEGRPTPYMAVWMPHPTSSKMRSLADNRLYHPDLVSRWRQWIADH